MEFTPYALLCYLSMLYAFCCGLAFYRTQCISYKILTWLFGITFFVEGGAFLMAYRFGNNLPLYNVFLLLEFLFLSLYFNYSIDTFKRHRLGIWIGSIGVSVGIANNMFFQSLREINSYFILFTGIAVISMSLYSFARSMLTYEEDQADGCLRYNPHFGVSLSFTFFWSTSFLLWGLYAYFTHCNKTALPWVHIAIRLVNAITYTALGTFMLRFHIRVRKQNDVR